MTIIVGNGHPAGTVTSTYSRLSGEVLQCVDSLLGIENIPRGACSELREKIVANAFNLVVVGQFKRGKTSLINALLGADILPVAVVPLTSIVTIITYEEVLNIKVFFNDGHVTEIGPEALSDYVTEKGNPKNVKDVREVVVTYPSPYLKDGVRLIDTPGVGSIYQHNTDVAYQYLPKSDAALFLLSVDQPMSKAELDFLTDVKEYSNKIFFLLNKADYLNESDLQESIEFSKSVLNEAMGHEIRIFPVSARLALEGIAGGSQEKLRKSCLPEFSNVLNTFLMEEKGKVLIHSVSNNLLRIIAHAKFALELEMKSLTTPLDELKRKLDIFENKKKEMKLGKEDFNILLDGQTKMLTKNILDEDLNGFRKELITREQAILEEQFSRIKDLPSRELKHALEQTVIDDIKEVFNTWRAVEDDRLGTAFETMCKRLIAQVDETIDELLKFSSDLFEVPFEEVKTEALWTMKSGFYYRFQEQPVGIEIVSSSLVLALPKFIGDKLILKRIQEYLCRIATMHVARIGNDFEKRIDKSKLDFRWEMRQRIEETEAGIENAIQKGAGQRERGTAFVDERKLVLQTTADALQRVKDLLMIIKQEVQEGKQLNQ